MGRASSIVIGLFQGRIEVGVRTHRGVESVQSMPLTSSWEDAWKSGLIAFDMPLADLLNRVNARGARATIFYASPDAMAEVNGFPMNASEAIAASELALSADPTHTKVGVVTVAWQTQGAKSKTDILHATDRIDTAEVVIAWAKRAGCRVVGLVPAVAADISAALRVLSEQRIEGRTCVLYVGEDRSALVGRVGTELAFARSVDTGIRLFAEAIVSASQGETSPYTVSQALSWIKANGVPARDGALPKGVDQVRLAQLLTPVQQRFVVEAKQTLRFGFGIDAAAATLVIRGAWGPCLGLAKLLSAQLDTDAMDAECRPSAEEGLHAASQWTGPTFLPPGELANQRQSRLSRLVAGGLAAALLLVVGEAGWIRSARADLDIHLQSQESAISAMNQTIAATQQAAKLAQEVNLLSAGVSLSDAGRVDYLALLGDLSRLTPPGMRIAEISTGTVRESAELTLRGTVVVMDNQPDPISPFLETLRASPVIASVDLGSTRLSEESGKRVKDFTLTARLRASQTLPTGGAQ